MNPFLDLAIQLTGSLVGGGLITLFHHIIAAREEKKQTKMLTDIHQSTIVKG